MPKENEMQETERNTSLHQESIDIDDAIGAAFDEVESGSDDDSSPPVDDDKASSDGRERDESGKFVKKEAREDDAAPDDDADEEITDQSVEAEEVEPDPSPAIDPPVSWSAEAKAEWQKLPRRIQDEIQKRELDVTRGFEQHAPKVRYADAISQALEPTRQALALAGIDEATYVRKLVTADQYLQSKPVEAIQWLAQTYGVNLAAMVEHDQHNPVDPTIAAMQQEVYGLKQFLSQQQQQASEQQKLSVMNTIAEFRDAKDDAGKPLHPYLDKVEGHMAALIQNGIANGLQDAYEQAIYANPTVRQQILSAQSAQEKQRRQAEQAKKAQEAKRIAKTNIRGSVAKGATPAASLEDEIARAYDQASAA